MSPGSGGSVCAACSLLLCVFALSVQMTELVRHWCVCWHVQCRLYGDDGVVMPTGAEGVSIPPEINTHSKVGYVLVLCKISMYTAMCLCSATIAGTMLNCMLRSEPAIGHTSYRGCVLD